MTNRMNNSSLKNRLLDKIQHGWKTPNTLTYGLLPVTGIYFLLHKLRQYAYSLRLKKTIRLNVPVLVVGGISVGGSGKTPLVAALVEDLAARGYKPGIISRGYGGEATAWPMEVNHSTQARVVGDEPQLLFELTGIPVVAGPDRIRDGRLLIDKYGCDVIVSDDGFQHFRLYRDFDIVVVEGAGGQSNGGQSNPFLLPSGPLREPISGLVRANAVVVNAVLNTALKGAGAPDIGVNAQVHCLLESLDIPIFSMSYQLANPRNIRTGERADYARFMRQPIHAVAAIGNPERFFGQLENKGLQITRHPFADHYQFSQADLNFADDHPIFMTEKDGIKCRHLEQTGLMWTIPARAALPADFFSMINHVLSARQKCPPKCPPQCPPKCQ